jgi:glycosyltransferase involved in cell wall biosynthesis
VVRVLIIAPAPLGETRIGGIANFIRGFVRHMPADFEAEICGVSVADEPHDGQWHTIRLADRDVRFLSVAHSGTARRSGRIPMKARVVGGVFRQRRHIATARRVVQVHAPAMDVALAGRSAPIIRVVHNDPQDLATAEGESLWRRAGWGLHYFERRTIRRASRVYFVNRETYEQYAARMPDDAAKLGFLPNFVDTSLFRPLTGEARVETRRRLADEVGAPADAPWVLFAGRIDHQKDPLLALDAMAALAQEGKAAGARLLIAGEGVLRQDAEKRAAELGIADRVRFLGNWRQDRLATLMSASDAFLLTSAFEAGPTVLYEALAAGLPAVSTKVGEAPRLISDRSTGWLAEDRSAASVAAGIAWVLDQDRDRMAEISSASVAKYDIRTVLAPFYEAHRTLAAAESAAEGASAEAPR